MENLYCCPCFGSYAALRYVKLKEPPHTEICWNVVVKVTFSLDFMEQTFNDMYEIFVPFKFLLIDLLARLSL